MDAEVDGEAEEYASEGDGREDEEELAMPPALRQRVALIQGSDGVDYDSDEDSMDVTGVPFTEDDAPTSGPAPPDFWTGAQPSARQQGAPVPMSQVLADTSDSARPRRGKGRRRGKSRRGKNKIPPNVAKMLGEANMCYVSQDFTAAIRLLEEVVRQAPRVSDPYHTLGLVYEEMEDPQRALECYLIAAYLTGSLSTVTLRALVWAWLCVVCV
jgi:hypothetical protein